MKLPSIAGCEILEPIGSGSGAQVFRCRLNGRLGALKLYDPLAVSRRHLGPQLERLGALPKHPSLVEVLAADLSASPPWCIQEWLGDEGAAPWRSLEQVGVTEVGRQRAWQWVMEMVWALAHLHLHGVTHGNLRPRHVVLEEREGQAARLRLCDVGEGLVDGVQRLEPTDHGLYLTPQQVRQPDLTATRLAYSFDVYALGSVAFRLLTGSAPRAQAFWDQEQERRQRRPETKINTKALLQAVEAQPQVQWPDAALDEWEQRRREVLLKALELDPAKRWLDAREVLAAFEAIERQQSQAAGVRHAARRASLAWKLQLSLLAVLLLSVGWAIQGGRRIAALQQQLGGIEQAHQQAMLSERQTQQQLRSSLQSRESALQTQGKQLATVQQRQGLAGGLASTLLEDWLQLSKPEQRGDESWRRKALASVEFCQQWLQVVSESSQPQQRLQLWVCLGQLQWSLQREAEALKALEQGRREGRAALGAAQGEQAASLQLWLGRCALALARIEAQHGRTASALWREAGDALSAALERNSLDLALRREAAQVCMDLGLESFAAGRWVEAQRDFGRLEMLLSAEIMGNDPQAADVFLLARAAFASGMIAVQLGRTQEGLVESVDALAVMSDLVMNRSPRQQDQALLLATAYLDLGDVLLQAAGAREGREACEQGQLVLLELLRLQPDWVEVKYQLSRARANLAVVDRDEGLPGDAVKRKQDAIEMLNEIVSEDPDNVRYAVLLARCRSEYAELMVDLNKKKEALPVAIASVQAMRGLLQADRQAADSWGRRQWQIQWAQMLGVLGHAQRASGNDAEAKSAFEEALAQWTELQEALPKHEVVVQGLNWCRERLARLR